MEKEKEKYAIPESHKKCRVDERGYNRHFNNLVNFGDTFEVHRTTNSKKIIHPHSGYSYTFIQDCDKIQGVHLISTLKKGIDKKLSTGFMPPTGLSEPKSVYLNIDNIKSNLHEPLIEWDLDSAYWYAAYNLGYMDYKTFLMTFNVDEWKHGKTAAIGNLAKVTRIDRYEKGVLVSENERLDTPEVYKDVRLHIINYVSDWMINIARSIGNDNWFMIHTDAIVVAHDYHLSRKIIAMCDKEHLSAKYKVLEFQNITDNEITIGVYPDLESPKKIKYNKNTLLTLY